MGINKGVLEHVIPSLYEDKDWYDFLNAMLTVADGSIWPFLKYNFESKTIRVITEDWVFPEIIEIDGGPADEVLREDFNGGVANREGVDADAGDSMVNFGYCIVPIGTLPHGDYAIFTPRVFFEGIQRQKYLDSDFVVYAEEPLEYIELVMLDNEFMANTFDLDYRDHNHDDGTGFNALSIPYCLSSYANLISGAYLRGNQISDVLFKEPDDIRFRIYQYVPVTYLGNGLFYSEFLALPKVSEYVLDYVSIVGNAEYGNLEIRGVNGNMFSVGAELLLDVGGTYQAIFKRCRGSYNYVGYYNDFTSLPANIIKEVYDSIPITILPENQSYGLSVSPSALYFGGNASDGTINTLSFNVFGNDYYRIEKSDSWLHVLSGSEEVSTGFGNKRFIVQVAQNSGDSTRTATISIIGVHTGSATVYVYQDNTLFSSLFSPMILTLEPGTTGTTTLSIEATTSWRVFCDNYLYGDGHGSAPNVEVTSGGLSFAANGDTASIESSGDKTLGFTFTARSFEYDCQNNYVFPASNTSEQVVLELSQEGVSDVKSRFTAILKRSLGVTGNLGIAGTNYNITGSNTLSLPGDSFNVVNNLSSNTNYTVEVVGVSGQEGYSPAGYDSYSGSGNGSGQVAFTVPVNSSEYPTLGDIRVLLNGVVVGNPIRFSQAAFTASQAIEGIIANVYGTYSTTALNTAVTLSVRGTFSCQKCTRDGGFLALYLRLPDSSSLMYNSVWAEGVGLVVSESYQQVTGDLIYQFDAYIPYYPGEFSSVPEVLAHAQAKVYILFDELPSNDSSVPLNAVYVADVVSWNPQ